MERTAKLQDHEPEKSGGVAALNRAFAILSAFQSGEKSASLAQLARRTGLYKSTILRLLGTLEHGGFVCRLEDGGYSIGPEPLRLAQIYQDSFRLRHVLEPILQQLCADSEETAVFYVRQGNRSVALHRVEPARGVRFSVREGEHFPIDHGASGKVLMAFSRPYRTAFEPIRERLWCVSYGEHDPDTASASVPVFGSGDALVGALTLSGPMDRMACADAMRSACRLLLAASARASEALGGNPLGFAFAMKLVDAHDLVLPC